MHRRSQERILIDYNIIDVELLDNEDLRITTTGLKNSRVIQYWWRRTAKLQALDESLRYALKSECVLPNPQEG